MVQGRNFVTALMLGTASVSIIVAGITVPAAAQAATGNYKIESQPLGQALMQLSRQANVDIVAPAKIVRGRTGKAVSAPSVDAALQQMLSGTGLSYKRAGSRYVIQSGNVQGGGSAPAPAPTAASQRPAAIQSQGRGTITGTVRDQASGASLKGALVELVGTGRKTATDDLGEFRFANAPTGNVTVRISYLGYAEQQSTIAVGDGETYAEEFTLIGGSGGQEIVVYGSRSARAQALNQERTAENVSTVISSDMLGNFSGTTLSESLRRASGVAFERDPNTADGVNIIVRGLEPDLNTVKLNGIELPEGTGRGRSASLSNILTESISKVTISKTLLPNQDSTGTGGLVEIETKTPLDRPRRFASFTIEGAKRARGFNDEFTAGGTLSGTFGDRDQFGISVSAQYRTRKIEQASYQIRNLLLPQHIPLAPNGQIVFPGSQDPTIPFPIDPDVDLVYPNQLRISRSDTDTENLALNLSLAWVPAEHTKLFFDYQRLDQTDTSVARSWAFDAYIDYDLLPVEALGGEQALTAIWFEPYYYTAISQNSYRPNNKTATDVYSFRGESKFGRWDFKYGAGYTKGRVNDPTYSMGVRVGGSLNPLDPALLLPSAVDPVEGRVVSPFAPRIPGDNSFVAPLLTEAGFALLNDPARYAFGSAQHQLRGNGRNTKATGTFRANYDVGHKNLKYIEAGLDYEKSDFRGGANPSVSYNPINFINLPSLQALGIGFAGGSLDDVGVPTNINLVDRADLIRFFTQGLQGIPTRTEAGPGDLIYRQDFPLDPRLEKAFAKEDELAAYVQTRVEFGKLEIVGGVRMTREKIHTLNLQGPRIIDELGVPDQAFFDANSTLVDESVTQTDYLPRILASYRPNENLVFRAGYYLSVARPQINLLSNSAFVTLDLRPIFGPNGSSPRLSISKGNPDLRPSRTDNFDVSLEYYDNDIGAIKLGAFLKNIDNFLDYNVSNGTGELDDAIAVIPSDPRFADVVDNPGDYFIQVQQPVNGTSGARIWGIEAAIEKQFTFLPGILSGLGVYANGTYTDSSREEKINYTSVNGTNETAIFRNQAFTGTSKFSGTLGLTYNKGGFDGSLMYTAQSRRLTGFQAYNMSNYEEAFGTLDLRTEYRFKRGGAEFRIYLEGSDLLRGPSDAAIETSRGADDGRTGKYYDSARYFGGRQFRLGLSTTF